MKQLLWWSKDTAHTEHCKHLRCQVNPFTCEEKLPLIYIYSTKNLIILVHVSFAIILRYKWAPLAHVGPVFPSSSARRLRQAISTMSKQVFSPSNSDNNSSSTTLKYMYNPLKYFLRNQSILFSYESHKWKLIPTHHFWAWRLPLEAMRRKQAYNTRHQQPTLCSDSFATLIYIKPSPIITELSIRLLTSKPFRIIIMWHVIREERKGHIIEMTSNGRG